jgi:hypothetical protein
MDRRAPGEGHRGRALAALAILVPAPSVGVVLAMGVDPGGPSGAAAWLLSKVWLFGLPLAWWVFVERGRLSRSPMRHGGLAAGMVTGLAIAAIVLAAYGLVGRSLIDHGAARAQMIGMGLGGVWRFAGLAFYWITINSVLEEYVWRWFVYRQWVVAVGGRIVWAVLLAGLAFTVHHVLALGYSFGWDPIVVGLGSLGVLIGGVMWSALYARYRSIWPGWISHACADVAVFAVAAMILFG